MIGASFRKRLLAGDISTAEEHLFTFFVSLLCMIVYIASDVFLPSLPEMSFYFKTTLALSQSVISIYMIGLSSTQIIHGLLADRFGKKNMLLIVLPIFLGTTLGCILAPTLHVLVLCRFFQAVSASACVVIGRTIFYDLFDPYRAQRAFSVLIPLVSLSPAIAPSIGGFLAIAFDWRASFVFVLVFALVVSAFVVFYLPESKPPEKRTTSIHIKTVFQSTLCMLRNISFIKSIHVLFMATLMWWYSVAGAPIMFHNLGLSKEMVGLLYFPAVIPYILAAFIARRKLKIKKPEDIYQKGVKLLVVSAFVLPLGVLTHQLNLLYVVLATLLISFSNGFIISMSMAAGISLYRNQTGLASGLLGTFQLLSGALASILVGFAGAQFNINYFAWYVFVSTMICYLIYLLISYFCKRQVRAKSL